MVPRSSIQQTPSGHVFRVERKREPAWYEKYRLPDGRQVQKRIGPAWTERGRPAAGFVAKRIAEAGLQDTLAEARRGTLHGMVRTGATFADAAAEFLRYIQHDRARKPETVKTTRRSSATSCCRSSAANGSNRSPATWSSGGSPA
jgi:hypothetical protein